MPSPSQRAESERVQRILVNFVIFSLFEKMCKDVGLGMGGSGDGVGEEIIKGRRFFFNGGKKDSLKSTLYIPSSKTGKKLQCKVHNLYQFSLEKSVPV